MEDRLVYSKRLMHKLWILQSAMNKDEHDKFLQFIDGVAKRDKPIINSIDACVCESRNDIVQINDNKYCCNCFHIIEGTL